MKTAIVAVLFTCFVLISADRAWSSAPELKGDSEWTNQHKSVLKLIVDASGMVSGTFTTGVGCGAGKPRKVVGSMNGLAISFTVNFEECESITAWNGHFIMDGANESLSTLWHLTIGVSPVSFKSTLAGADIFTRTAMKTGCKPGSLSLMGVGC